MVMEDQITMHNNMLYTIVPDDLNMQFSFIEITKYRSKPIISKTP